MSDAGGAVEEKSVAVMEPAEVLASAEEEAAEPIVEADVDGAPLDPQEDESAHVVGDEPIVGTAHVQDEEEEGEEGGEEDAGDTVPTSRPTTSDIVSIENDPLLDESSAYAAAELVRPLQPWEISRDHLVFGDMCGLDQGKRHLVHVLDLPLDGHHGGIILTAAGNTAQIITLADDSSQAASNVLHRKYLFGTSGGGIGALAVHPSRRFFAVAEKGTKPSICIYQYPACRVCRVLRNGTELSYSSVSFSQDGETLASVGGSPDFLLTVWNWRQQQTILRCKAFGQDVFSVRFAPNDAGFLTTSGVGHIRFWKMASTFTGLKLQGDIGKFGKSELSDIEAFCVLPDKKVLSATERGVLLLWDGNFIKCEIMTSRRHLPHAGSIHVVQYEPEHQQIVTAGSDGTVKFWSFDAIDKADVPPDEQYALVPMKRHVLVQPQLDIRAVVRCGDNRYLVQSADGAIHLLILLDHNATNADGQSYEIVMDYVENPTGRATGVVCSPYEHLAVSCGHDGSVRAWDYVQRSCLFAVSTTVFCRDENDGAPVGWTAAASAITWVPSAGAMPTNASGTGSRQIVVGFGDGLVRVLLIDLARQSFVRTNVFKPHSERVTALQFSHSGVFLATASADGTFFLFKVAPSPKTSKFAKFPPDYVPLGFQKVEGAIRSLVWREDDEALLLTTEGGVVVEYDIPMDGSLEELADLRSQSKTDSAADGGGNDDTAAKESETYELKLSSRTFRTLQRQRPLSTKELVSLESLGVASGHPVVDDAIRSNFHNNDGSTTALQAWAACYYTSDTLLISIKSPSASGGSSSVVLCQWGKSNPLREFATESTSAVVSLGLSLSRKYVLAGLVNGKFHVRTKSQPHAFLTGEFHDGSHFQEGPTHASLSFDDSFIVVCGADGNVSISRLHNEKMELAARLLDEKFQKAVAEAMIVGEQAMEKQKAQLDMLLKATADEAKNNGDESGGSSAAAAGGVNELGMLPAFQRAKAYAAYMEAQLDGSGAESNVAKDDEVFQGVVRLVTDSNSTLGLPLAAAPSATAPDEAQQVLTLLEVPDIQNPNEAYTIEDAKRKSEADARALSTRSKQDRTRDVLQQMRQQLQELKTMDASYAPENRLEEDEWEIDLDYGELLAKRGDEACEEVKRELAFAVEREELLLLKMRETYVSQLAVELFTLHAFASGLSVQSFRTMKMPPLLQKRLNEIHLSDAVKTSRQTSSSSLVVNGAPVAGGGSNVGVPRRPSVLHIMAKGADLDESFPLKEEERKLIQHGALPTTGLPPPLTSVGATGHHHTDPATTGASVHGFEARKRLRAERKERLNAWLANKPGENADDPRDLVAIAFAQRNMGDYKLKTAPNYVVPEAQRVNAAKKRRQMALLEEKIYEAKLSFNAKVLELRELKLLLLQEMRSDQSRIEQLSTWLGGSGGCDGRKSELKLEVDLSEWPEQRERVTDADIAFFLKDRTVKPHAITESQSEPPVAGSGARRHSNVASEMTIDGKRVDLTDRNIAAVSRCLGTSGDTSAGSGLGAQDASSTVLRVRNITVDELGPVPEPEPSAKSSKGNSEERAIREYLIRQEIVRLERKQREEVAAFDDAVAHLRREKMRLDVVFKQCELKLFTLLSELVLLEQFESRENLLSTKLEKSKSEKAMIVAEITDIQESMANKKKELEEWSKQEKAIQAEFLTLVNGANAGSSSSSTPHPNFAALQKIFKRKIKRAKKKPAATGSGKDGGGGDGGDGDPAQDGEGNGGGHDEDDDEDDEDDDDSDFGDDDDDDDDDEDDVCPQGCDLQLYEKVLALRERRADVDDASGELTKAVDELRKSNDRQVAKQRQIDKELQATEQDIQAFQSEKQTRFNQLDVVVALSKQQIRCLSFVEEKGKWELPEQAQTSLVFAVSAFDALADRIESLQRENKMLRQQFKDLHKQQSVLAKEKKVQQDTIARIQQKCEQLQLLKFGQLVDMELLDRACDTTQVGALQAKVRVKEMDAERELARAKQSQQQLKRQILLATEQNTALLGRLAALNARQRALEKELNHAPVGQRLLQDESAQQEQEMQERNKLVKIVKLQAREVDALKQEIGLLRGKDGKVYAPR